MSNLNERDSALSNLRRIQSRLEQNAKLSGEVNQKLQESVSALIASRVCTDGQLRKQFHVADPTIEVDIRRETEKLELLEEACINGPVPKLFLDPHLLLSYWYCGAFRNAENGRVYHSCGEHLCRSCMEARRLNTRRSMINRVLTYGQGTVLSVTLSVPVSKDAIEGWNTLKRAMKQLRNRIHAERMKKKKPECIASVIGYVCQWDLAKVDDGFRNHVHGLMTIRQGTEPSAIHSWLGYHWPKIIQEQEADHA